MRRFRHVGRIAVLLLVAPFMLAGCAAGPRPPAERILRDPRLCSPARAGALDCGLYIATRAALDGAKQSWLPTEPLRLWFEQMNGARTAIIDGPLNTVNVPTLEGATVLWNAGHAAVSDVGCLRHCEADSFAGTVAGATAAYRVDPQDGAITITAGPRTIVFTPTAAPAPPASCDATSIDPLPCPRFVSVQATEHGRTLEALRLHPITVRITGTRGHHAVQVRAPDGRTWSVALTSTTSGFTSDGASASGGSDGAEAAFVDALLRGRVEWRPHFSTVLLVTGSRTLELEAAR